MSDNNCPYAKEAATFAEAIRNFAANKDAINNFEFYLSIHFEDWLNKFANTPEAMAEEIKCFSEINF